MKEIKNVIICGLGAIGSALGEKILHTKPDTLKVLVDEERLKNYTNTPRVLNGNVLNFNYITPDEQTYKADLILIAVKSDALNDVINNISNFVTDKTIIISLLNGVTSEEKLATVYGWDKILPAYYIGSSVVRVGEKITHDGRATIVFGAKDELAQHNVNEVRTYFESVNINYKISDDIMRSLWAKFMLNVACNQISAILGLTFGEMQQSEEFKSLAIKVMEEVLACAKAVGIKNTGTMIQEVFEHIKTITPSGKTSMLQDVEAGRKTEVDIFAGSVIEYGKKFGIPTPYNIMLKSMLDIIYSKQKTQQSETHYKILQ